MSVLVASKLGLISPPGVLQIQRLPKLEGLEKKVYLAKSRDDEVDDVKRWLDDTNRDGEFAYWINGTAGVGKSVLACHLADLLKDGNRLGCLVHLGANVQHSLSDLIQGMACELTALHPSCYDTIVAEAKKETSSMEGVDSTFERYLYKPIKLLNVPAPLVFIVDGLDEWPQHEPFLKALNTMHGDHTRFIFTSRTHDEIKNALRHLSLRPSILSTVSGSTMQSYFRDAFTRLRVDVTSAELDSLVDQAKGLFIWAATVCRLMEFAEGATPVEVLKTIISSPRTATTMHSESLIWDLYNKGLPRLCRNQDLHRKTLRMVLSVMAAIQRDISLKHFSKFVGIEELEVRLFHSRLRAFYTTEQQWQGNIIYPLHLTTHASFRDFLFDNDATAHSFVVGYQHGHAMISEVCHSHVMTYLKMPEAMPFETPGDLNFEEYVFTYWILHDFAAKRSGFLLDDALHKHLQILQRLIFPSNPKLSSTPSLPSFKMPSQIMSIIEGIINPFLGDIAGQLLPAVSIH